MITTFDSRYENPDPCELIHKCRSKKCGDDVYIIPGWDLTLPIIFGNRGWRMDSYIQEYFPRNDVYTCRNLPYYEMNHRADKISDALLEEMNKHSKDKKVSLIGSCFGGIVAQDLVIAHPERIHRLALVHSFDSVPLYQGAGKEIGLTDDMLERAMTLFMNSRTGRYALSIASEAADIETAKGWMEFWRYNNTDNIHKIEVPTYVLNCSSDILVGRFPEIEHAEQNIDPFCFHHRMRLDHVQSVADFINAAKEPPVPSERI